MQKDNEMLSPEEIAFMVEEAPLLHAIKDAAMMALLATTQLPVDPHTAMILGKLNLSCRAHYEWYTGKMMEAHTTNAGPGHD